MTLIFGKTVRNYWLQRQIISVREFSTYRWPTLLQ